MASVVSCSSLLFLGDLRLIWLISLCMNNFSVVFVRPLRQWNICHWYFPAPVFVDSHAEVIEFSEEEC